MHITSTMKSKDKSSEQRIRPFERHTSQYLNIIFTRATLCVRPSVRHGHGGGLYTRLNLSSNFLFGPVRAGSPNHSSF